MTDSREPTGQADRIARLERDLTAVRRELVYLQGGLRHEARRYLLAVATAAGALLFCVAMALPMLWVVIPPRSQLDASEDAIARVTGWDLLTRFPAHNTTRLDRWTVGIFLLVLLVGIVTQLVAAVAVTRRTAVVAAVTAAVVIAWLVVLRVVMRSEVLIRVQDARFDTGRSLGDVDLALTSGVGWYLCAAIGCLLIALWTAVALSND